MRVLKIDPFLADSDPSKLVPIGDKGLPCLRLIRNDFYSSFLHSKLYL